MANNGTEVDIKTLQAEMKQLRADLANLGETLRDTIRHGGAEAAAKARETGEELWGEAKSFVQGVSEEIEQKPLTAALAAFGIGMVLGLLFSTRRN